MITKEYNTTRKCLFCASEYHLEMILLPYIKETIENSKYIIFTQKDLENTLETLLKKINLKDTDKDKIKEINWNVDDNLKFTLLEKYIKDREKIEIVIYGNKIYKETINKCLKKISYNNINIIECFDVSEQNINLNEISKNYKEILNTREI